MGLYENIPSSPAFFRILIDRFVISLSVSSHGGVSTNKNNKNTQFIQRTANCADVEVNKIDQKWDGVASTRSKSESKENNSLRKDSFGTD